MARSASFLATTMFWIYEVLTNSLWTHICFCVLIAVIINPVFQRLDVISCVEGKSHLFLWLDRRDLKLLLMCIYIPYSFVLFLTCSIVWDERLGLVNQLLLISCNSFFERWVKHHFFSMVMTGVDKMHVFTRKLVESWWIRNLSQMWKTWYFWVLSVCWAKLTFNPYLNQCLLLEFCFVESFSHVKALKIWIAASSLLIKSSEVSWI